MSKENGETVGGGVVAKPHSFFSFSFSFFLSLQNDMDPPSSPDPEAAFEDDFLEGSDHLADVDLEGLDHDYREAHHEDDEEFAEEEDEDLLAIFVPPPANQAPPKELDFIPNLGSIILHIDMDCFYCVCGRKGRE